MTDSRSGPPATTSSSGGFAGSTRQRALEAYESARDGVSGAGRKASGAIESAPLIALAGGIAAGALIAALLPRTRAETKALRPAAKRVRETAKAAAQAARETGSQRLEELGLTREKGEETIRSLIDGVTDAAKASGQAAIDAARKG